MGQVLALDALLAARHVWRGQQRVHAPSEQSTGIEALDAAMPLSGWPEGALTEILIPVDGVGELDLLMPTLVRLTAAGKLVVLIAPPYVPYPPGWQARGVDMSHVRIIDGDQKQALWVFEQCLRSGSCAAVVGWPTKIDHHGLRRLQVAADTGRSLGFVIRDKKHAESASPASLRLEIDIKRHVAVRKCRGGNVPNRAFLIPQYQ
ncbi:MAG: translesion DNA synthesis-associated protein ImuA [Luteimonas sp.]